METYRIALIWETSDSKITVDAEGVPMAQMKQTIIGMVERNNVPVTATIHVVNEQTNKVYFRNLLSSLSFIGA
jgi:hypothetical protein